MQSHSPATPRPAREMPRSGPAIDAWFGFAALEWERHRRIVVLLIFVVYWLLIFEGVLRKWLFPQWGRPLFFVRDPIVLCIYALVLIRGVRLSRSLMLQIGLGFAVIGLVLIPIQAAFDSNFKALLSFYGWRNYFLNIPLAFVIGRYFEMKDLERLAVRTLQLCIPMALLVLMQVNSPGTSPINAGFGVGRELFNVNTSASGVVRPPGTFTADSGMSTFVTSSLSMAIAMWILPAAFRPIRGVWLWAATAAIMACVAVSGSRANLIWASIVILGAIVGLSFVSPVANIKMVAIVAVCLGLATLIAPILFPRSTQAFITRWTNAGAAETEAYGSGGVFARARHELLLFHVLIPITPAAGYGLGSAGNASWQLGTRSELIPFQSSEQISAAESDWGRHILELGPIFGCGYIVFRILFVIGLLHGAFLASKRSGHPLPLLLGIYLSPMLLQGQITGYGTVNGYGWVFAGLCIAASEHATNPVRGVLRFRAASRRRPALVTST
jgi:hypothetical protein